MGKILIVDDEEPIRKLLMRYLGTRNYDCVLASDAVEARSCLEEEEFDVILCDINMPGESGLDLVRDLRGRNTDLAAVMVTGADEPAIAKTAFDVGAYDYIVKPLELNRVLISVTNALHRRELEVVSRTYRNMLELTVAERTEDLRNTLEKLQRTLGGVIHAMALTIEKRDPYTAGHQDRVAHLTCAMAKAMDVQGEKAKGLEMAAQIHDIGKIRIPSEILSKPGQLSDIEFALIKTHPKVGYEILRPIEFPWPVAEIVYQHHEKMDGSGYPRGLSGKEILLEAKILAVADVVEAMAFHRPYRPALGIDKALTEIVRGKGRLYEPEVVKACLAVFKGNHYRFESENESHLKGTNGMVC
jgi:putative two-component system response regulator